MTSEQVTDMNGLIMALGRFGVSISKQIDCCLSLAKWVVYAVWCWHEYFNASFISCSLGAALSRTWVFSGNDSLPGNKRSLRSGSAVVLAQALSAVCLGHVGDSAPCLPSVSVSLTACSRVWAVKTHKQQNNLKHPQSLRYSFCLIIVTHNDFLEVLVLLSFCHLNDFGCLNKHPFKKSFLGKCSFSHIKY